MIDRVLRWRALEHDGTEEAHVRESDVGIEARSRLTGTRDGTPFDISYELQLAPDWTFRSIVIRRSDGSHTSLWRGAGGAWTDGAGAPIPGLVGCIDVDFAGSPLTNTLPIRRNRFVKDVPQRFDMAWISFDTLTPRRDGQVYIWLGGQRWRYEAADGGFTANLTVDDDGFVIDYDGLFGRV